MLMTRILLAVVFVPMLIEARLAAVNERAQRRRGGVDAPHDLYEIIRVAYPFIFLSMIGEGAIWPGRGQLIPGLAMFAAAKALKWWAVASLGQAWTFRVIVCPGTPLVTTGPYRWLRHPNYIAVLGELLGVALMSGAIVTGPIGTLYFAVLLVRRIAVEERALQASGR